MATTSWAVPYVVFAGDGDEDEDEARPRPYLGLEITGPNGSPQKIMGLVDSGADRTGLPVGYAPLLGYDVGSMAAKEVEQVAATMTTYVPEEPVAGHVIGPEIEKISFQFVPVFFDGSLSAPALWGRTDFFRAFDVCFREMDQTFELIRC